MGARRWVATAAAVLGLVVAGGTRAAEPPARKCVLYQVGDLKAEVAGARAILHGAINGHPVRVLLDTGATGTLLHRSAARTLGVPLQDVPGMQMGGAGGVTQAQSAYVDQLQLAGATLKGFRMLVAGEGAADFDVLLGEDVLGRYDVEFDIPHGAVRLLSPRDCGEGDMAYWASAYNETPIVGDTHDKVNIDVQLNGRRVRAILDSGASVSVGTPSAAAAARVKLAESDFRGHGMGGLTLTGQVGVLDSFSIGQETIRNAKLRFSDLFGATVFDHTGSRIGAHMDDEPQMLLGFDFLRSHRVLISHTRHMLYFTYEGGPVFDTARIPAAPAGASPPTPPTPGAPASPSPLPGKGL